MGGFLSPDIVEQIRAANPIVEVIQSYFPLKRAGANFSALCPFHREKSPSFSVNPGKQIFYCFGCHKGGDVFRFLMDYENITFVEAAKRLAQRAHIALEFEESDAVLANRSLKDSLLQIHEQLTQRWQQALHTDVGSQIARDYLEKRGVSPEAVELFRLGYAPDSWDDTVNWAKSKKFDLDLVEKGGLIIRKDDGAGFYNRFRGRLMFPICDDQGRVIGFSGRVLSGDEKTAKYVNSPETPIFTKGKVMFGLDKAKRPMLDAQYAIICEGQLDLIACHMAGVRNVVAPQGTAFTTDHARLLKRYVNDVILCFDGDSAGQKAAVRALSDLLEAGLTIRVANLPMPHDPDSYVKEFGGEAFRALIEKAHGFFDFYLDLLCREQGAGSDKGKLAITRAMAEALHKADSPILADTYAQKTAQRLGVSAEAVKLEFRKLKRARRSDDFAPAETAAPEETPSAPAAPPPPLELWLLLLLFQSEDAVEWATHHLDLNWLLHGDVRAIVERRFAAHHEMSWNNFAAFLDGLESDAQKALLSRQVMESRPTPELLKVLEDTVRRLRDNRIDAAILKIQTRLGAPDHTAESSLTLFQLQKELKEARKSPLKPHDLSTTGLLARAN